MPRQMSRVAAQAVAPHGKQWHNQWHLTANSGTSTGTSGKQWHNQWHFRQTVASAATVSGT